MTSSPLTPAFRRFLTARLLGVIGRHFISIAIGWEIYDRTRSALALGLIGLVQVIPVVALALVTGPFVDRHDRRRVASVAFLGTACVALAFAAITWWNWPTWLFYVCTFALGVSSAFSQPSLSSLIPAIVPTDHLARANAWNASMFELSSMAGPATGGALIGVTGATWPCYVVSCAFALIAAMAVRNLVVSPDAERAWRERAMTRQPAGAWREGVRFLRRTPLLLAAITLDLFAVLFAGATALLPVFARDILQVGAPGLGWLRAAPAIGAFGMAVLSTRLRPWQRPGRALIIAVVIFGLAMMGFGASTSFPLSLLLLCCAGAVDNISVVIRATLEQTVTPDALRGRVAAVNYVFIGLSNELGAFESGLAAAWLGAVRAVVLGGAATLGVVGIIARAWPQLWRLGPLSTLRPADESSAT